MSEELAEAAASAAKTAKKAAVLAFLAVVIAAGVLTIDNGIKRAILDETAKARGILDEFKAVADGAKKAGEAGAGPGSAVDGGDGVDDAARAPAKAGGDAGNGVPAKAGRPVRAAARPRGHD